jgi:hypothetical protein
MIKLTFYKLNLNGGSRVELQKITRSYRTHRHDLTSSTSQHLQQGLTNPEYSIVLHKTYPTKRKDSKDMLVLRKAVELEKRSFAEKLYYAWILTFNILNKF